MFKRPYLGLPWSDFHQIWTVEVFHHALLMYGIQNAEIQKKKKIVTSSLRNSIAWVVWARDTSDNHINQPTTPSLCNSVLDNINATHLYCYRLCLLIHGTLLSSHREKTSPVHHSHCVSLLPCLQIVFFLQLKTRWSSQRVKLVMCFKRSLRRFRKCTFYKGFYVRFKLTVYLNYLDSIDFSHNWR